MSPEKVRQIAEGRVWDAIKAKQIGLVDSLGSLDDAITWTAKKASVDGNYNVSVYPVEKPSIWSLLADGSAFDMMMNEMTNQKFSDFVMEYLQSYLSREKVQARMADFKVGF